MKTDNIESLRKRILEDKAEYRDYLTKATIPEKLRLLEEMRDFTLATQQVRDENRCLLERAWERESQKRVLGRGEE
jgi:hypothetical protein